MSFSSEESQSREDKSDRKSLDLLIKSLFSQKEQHTEPKLSKYKQLAMSKYCSPKEKAVSSPKVRKKRGYKETASKSSRVSKKSTPESKTLTGWLSKSKKPDNGTGSNFQQYQDVAETKENNPAVENCTSTYNTKHKNSTQPTEAFLRYGIRTPSFEDILKFQKKYKSHKELIENIKPVQLPTKQLSPIKLLQHESPLILDCKHLSLKDIRKSFYENYEFAYDTFNGKRYCERHERFKCEQMKDNFTLKDLRYSSSTSVFSIEQKEVLLSLMHEEFDNGDPYTFNQYYYKVLLPEMCLKIFMDIHKMDMDEAVIYLEQRPVDD